MQTDLMHGSVLVVGQVQPFGPWQSCPGGRGVGDQENISSLILRSIISLTVYTTAADLKTTYF